MKCLYTVLLFVTLIIAANAYQSEFLLEDLEKYEVNKCESDADCMEEYQLKCRIEKGKSEGYCVSRLYCHNNNEKCLYEVKNDNAYVSYQPVNSDSLLFKFEKPTIILESCSIDEYENGRCFTRYCDEDKDCFSKSCFDNVCITDSMNSTSVCTNDPTAFPSVVDLKKFDRSKLTCKLVEQEPCKNDEDCASGTCQKNPSGVKICVNYTIPKSGTGIFKLILEFLFIGFIAALIFFAFKFLRGTKSSKKDLKVKYEMEETFLKKPSREYVELEEDIEDYNLNEFEQRVNKRL